MEWHIVITTPTQLPQRTRAMIEVAFVELLDGEEDTASLSFVTQSDGLASSLIGYDFRLVPTQQK